MDINALAQLVSIGTLFVFFMVSAGVLQVSLQTACECQIVPETCTPSQEARMWLQTAQATTAGVSRKTNQSDKPVCMLQRRYYKPGSMNVWPLFGRFIATTAFSVGELTEDPP